MILLAINSSPSVCIMNPSPTVSDCQNYANDALNVQAAEDKPAHSKMATRDKGKQADQLLTSPAEPRP